MSNQEPDGWCAWHPDKGWMAEVWSETEFQARGKLVAKFALGERSHWAATAIEQDRVALNWATREGWQIKPVMLISPQELTRLRLIAEWAKEIEALFLRCLNEYDTAPAYDFWLKKLQAITAPVEKVSIESFVNEQAEYEPKD